MGLAERAMKVDHLLDAISSLEVWPRSETVLELSHMPFQVLDALVLSQQELEELVVAVSIDISLRIVSSMFIENLRHYLSEQFIFLPQDCVFLLLIKEKRLDFTYLSKKNFLLFP